MDLSFIIRSTLNGELDSLPYVPEYIPYKKLPGAGAACILSSAGHFVFQLVSLDGVDIWDAQYNLRHAHEFECGINKPFSEFHNAVNNHNICQWKGVNFPYDKAGHGGFTTGPYIHNTVKFLPGKYRTTDFHYDEKFLAPFARAYPKLDMAMSNYKKAFAQIDTALPHTTSAGNALAQILKPTVREAILPVHYYNMAQEFLTYALEFMDPQPIITGEKLSVSLQEKVVELESILRTEYQKPIYLPQLANRLESNLTYLQDAFKKQYKKTINQYLMGIRVQEAKKFLLNTSFDLDAIAICTGFHDASHLIRHFKSHTNLTPTQFRNSK